jgi:hypothetical protein
MYIKILEFYKTSWLNVSGGGMSVFVHLDGTGECTDNIVASTLASP